MKEKENTFVCECNIIHTDRISASQDAIPEDEILLKLANFMNMFSDSTRLRILWALEGGELCVCDFAALLGMTKPAITRQLHLLCDADLIKYRKTGCEVFYSLSGPRVREILEKTLGYISEKRK